MILSISLSYGSKYTNDTNLLLIGTSVTELYHLNDLLIDVPEKNGFINIHLIVLYQALIYHKTAKFFIIFFFSGVLRVSCLLIECKNPKAISDTVKLILHLVL